VTLVLVALIGVVGGALAGLFGIGGGILFVPTLALVLGLTQLHAEATSLLAILPTALAGSWRQWRYGNVELRVAAIVGAASIAGVQGGVVLAESLPEHVLRRLFGALLIALAINILWRTRRRSGTLAG
jgi:uncharacterized membrane protein YfcA